MWETEVVLIYDILFHAKDTSDFTFVDLFKYFETVNAGVTEHRLEDNTNVATTHSSF